MIALPEWTGRTGHVLEDYARPLGDEGIVREAVGDDGPHALLDDVREDGERRRERGVPGREDVRAAARAGVPVRVDGDVYRLLDICAVEVDRGLRHEGVTSWVA